MNEPIIHGKNCPKAPHVGTGYLHDNSDDSPYDVGGLIYCGRCHWSLSPAELRAAHGIPDQPVSDTPMKDAQRIEALVLNYCGNIRCNGSYPDPQMIGDHIQSGIDRATARANEQLAAARRENAELRQRASDHGDFIGFMTDALGGFPCCHEGGQHHSTPPMMWPWLVACIVKKAIEESAARAEAAEATVKRMVDALKESDSMLEFYYGRFSEELATHERQRLDALRDKNMEALNP